MLGFCSNAGPSFLFGIVGPFFSGPVVPWILWAVHILSAILVGVLLPGGSRKAAQTGTLQKVSVPNVLEKAVRTMALICGWVILFRVILGFLDKWVFGVMPPWCRVILSGILELSNGCLMLDRIRSLPLRFLAAGMILSFGGLCVAMQTMAICGDLRIGRYLKGKALQMLLFLVLSVPILVFAEAITW
jgi:hypothetical protein